MMNYYNSLRSGRDTWRKKDVGDFVGSPPDSSKNRMSVTWFASLLFLLIGFSNYAQTTLISPTGDGGFENGTTLAANNWTAVNSTTDSWIAGATPVVSAGARCAFISSTPSSTQTWTYSQISTIQHVYYDVTIPAGETILDLSFKWKVGGEGTTTSDWDNMKVFFGTTANIGVPVANTAVSATYQVSGAGATSGMYKLSSAAYGTSTITLSGVAGTTYRLVFSWKSDSSDIVNPPAAIDEVSLISRAGIAPTAAPITFTTTAVSATGMTVNWVDNSTNETAFRVYRSTDNVTFTQVGTNIASTTVAGTGTAYSSVQTGLTAGTTYFYRVVSVVELESSFLTGSQTTTAGTTYYWVGTSGGTWGTAANWNTNPLGGGSIRTTPATTDILIVDGAGFVAGGSMIISHNVVGQTIGQLRVTSNTTLSLQSDTTTARTTTISGGPGDDLVVEAGSTLQLINAANACAIAFSGTGNTGLIAGTYNAAGSTSNVITTTGGTGTLVTVTGSVNNNIVGSSGCMLGSTTTLAFGAASNYLHGSFTNTNGFIPLATWDTTSTVTITGGTTSTAITNAAQSFGNFVYNSTTSTGTMSVWGSGTAVIKGNLTISATGSGVALFRACTSGTVTVNGNLNINGTSVFQVGNGTASLNGVIVLGNTTIATLAQCNLNSAVLSQRGITFTNNGVLTGTASASALNFFSPTNVPQTFAGSGTVLTNIGSLGVQNTGGLTITHTNTIPTLRVNLFNGTITNSNKITIGTGAALGTVVQIGYTGNVLAGGSFDVAPTFNLGTGTHGVIYGAELAARTTGLEIPPSRILASMTSTNANGVVVAGGNLATGTLTFGTGTGNITTSSSNLLTVTGTTVGSVVRTSLTAYVNGPLALTLPASLAATTYTWPIGKSALNTFALVGATTNAGGTVTVQAEAFDGASGGTPGLNISAISSTKYWAASITAGAANFTSSLIQLNDVPTGRDAIAASATQGGAYDLQGGVTVNTTATTMTTTAPANTTLPGFFLMGNKAAANITNVVISPVGNLCTNVARTVTADVTPGGGAVTSVVINWTLNGVAQTPVTMTATTSNGFPLLDSYTGTIPTVTPANATVAWSITATDANTLVKTVAGTTYKDEPLFGMASATASTLAVCNGGTTTLTAALNAPASASIGTSTTTEFSGSVYRSGGATGDFRHQLIYTAAELTAAGVTAGNLTSLGFTTTNSGSGYVNFTISLGSASATTAVAAFQSVPLTQVFTQASVSPTLGLNTYTFQTPYAWNGTSDILVNICYNVPVFGTSCTVAATTPSAARNSSFLGGTGTCTAASGTTYANRPLATFGYNAAPAITSVSWSDGTNTVTGNPVTVTPSVSATYTATITAIGCTISPAGLNVVVNPIPNAPTQTVFTSTCGTNVPLVAVSDPNAISGAIFKWYNAAGTTVLQSNVSTTYLTAITATTTFQVAVLNPATGCESAKTTIVASVVSPDPIDAIANQTVCVGNPFSLTATSVNSGYTYTWTAVPAVGAGIVAPGTGASQTITPTVAGSYTYTVSATDGVCSTTRTFNGTVNAYPTLLSAAASPATVCANGISALTNAVPGTLVFAASTGASLDPMTGATTVLGSANDDTVTAAPVNIGFSFTFNGVAYTQYNASPDGWISLGSGTASNSFSNDIALATNLPKLAPLWDDLATGTTGNVTAVTTGTAPNRILKVQWFVTIPRNTTGPANANFQAWLYEGSNKIEYRYGTIAAPASASSGYTIGATNFSSITFSSNTASTVTTNNANAAAPVSGTMYSYSLPSGNVTWSPTTELYTDAGATIPYTGTLASVVYSKPTTNRTYYATLSANGCDTVSGAVTVTQSAELVADPTGPTAICLGSPTIPAGPITYTNGEVTTSYFSSNPAVATIDQATGVLTPLTAGTTNIIAQNINVTTGCTSSAANALAVTVSAPIAITTNPAAQTVLEYDGVTPTTTTFTAAASGSVLSYRWQVSPTGGSGSYVDIADLDPLYSGQATNTLTIANATAAVYNGLYYLCVVTPVGPCTPAIETTGALLTVSNLTTTDPTFGTPICGTGSHTFTTVSTPPTGVTYEWYYATVANLSDAQPISGDFGGLTFPLGVTGASLQVDGISATENLWYFFVVASDGTSFVQTNAAQVVVNPAQTVGPTLVADKTICFNAINSSTFTVDSAGGTGFQWQYSADGITGWNPVATAPPAGITYSGASSATLTVNSTAVLAVGTYYYRCSVAGPSGCPAIESNVATLTVTTPTITASASVPSLCGTGTSILTASGAGIGGTYAWTSSATLSGPLNLDTATAIPTATTTYTVTGTTAAGCIATGTVTVIVNPVITATATASPNVVCFGTDSQLLSTYSPVPVALPSQYSFVGSTGTYTPITGGNATTASGDDGTQFPLPIGFNFTYNGTVFTDFGLTTNGHIRLGSGAASYTNDLTTNNNIIAPLWDDNNLSAGNITYKLSGTSGSQVLTVQWENVAIGGGGATANSVSNHQVQLFEGSNVIKFNYGAIVPNTLTASIGISGATGNFLSVTPGSPASASTVSSATENSSISSVANIPSGTSYTFTPPVLPTITYSWSPSTFLSNPNIANPIAQGVTAETTYTVTVTSSTGCSDTETVTVGVASAIAITGHPQSATFCQGTTASLSIGATGASLIYQWRLNGVDLFGEINSSITIPNATPANSGNYDVVITDACGGSPVTSNVAVLTIVPTPTVTAPSAWPSTVCAGTTTTAIPLTGSVGATYNITGGAAIGLANQTGVTAIPSFTGIAGTASISITPVVGTCTGTAISYSVTIQALPTTVTVSPATTTICSSDVNAILLTGSGGFMPSYCTPTIGSTDGTDFLNNFSFGGIVNNGTGQSAAQYGNFTSLTANVTAGVATPISLQSGSSAQQFGLWIDFNQNGVFEATEFGALTTTSTTAVVSGNITIPTTAFNGVTRMRVMARFSSAVVSTNACSYTSYGEYEDYSVNISGATNPVSQVYVWSSTGGGLFTDAAATTAYTGTPSATVYAKPSANATITATYTNAAGCTASGNSVITVNTATTWYADADGDTFGNTAVSQSACSQPSGYVSNNTDCDDTNINIYQFATFYVDADGDTYGSTASANVCSGLTTPSGYSTNNLDCDDTNALLNPTNPCATGKVVNLTLFVQGYYVGGSTMTSVKLNQDGVSPDTDVEDITVELHDAVDYSLVDTAIGTLKTDGTLSVTFNTAAAGSYYIAVKGSNLVQTWSAAPQVVGTTPLNYDFSTSASQAYGDNMSEVEPGVFALYQGDLSLDDLVDFGDYTIWEAKYLDFAFGVEPTDLNGDGLVDFVDYTIWEANYLNFIFAAYPF